MNDEDSKLVTSALMGLAGFLASHVFSRLSKKGEEQEGLTVDTAVLESRVERLEEDAKEIKKDLASHLREHARSHRRDD